MSEPLIAVSAVVLGARDPAALAEFYRRLLGWEVRSAEPGWVSLRGPGPGARLSFQEEVDHVPPVWPQEPGQPQMQLHLDLGTPDLDAAVAHALSVGARLAEHQPQDGVRVCLDPAGHPFCLFQL